MPACHTIPFIQPGVLISATPTDEQPPRESPSDACDYCGSGQLTWRKCKLICENCKQINKSCADL